MFITIECVILRVSQPLNNIQNIFHFLQIPSTQSGIWVLPTVTTIIKDMM